MLSKIPLTFFAPHTYACQDARDRVERANGSKHNPLAKREIADFNKTYHRLRWDVKFVGVQVRRAAAAAAGGSCCLQRLTVGAVQISKWLASLALTVSLLHFDNTFTPRKHYSLTERRRHARPRLRARQPRDR